MMQALRSIFLRALLLVAATALLGGCITLIDTGPAPVRMQLTPPMPTAAAQAKPLPTQMMIMRPNATATINRDAIALLFNNREVRYLANVRWESTAPQLVQQALVQAFESANVFRGVAPDGTGIADDVRLMTDIRQFVLRYAEENGIPTAVIAAQFQLVDTGTGTVLDSLTVETTAPASGRDNHALVAACEAALGKALAQVVPWAAKTATKAKGR